MRSSRRTSASARPVEPSAWARLVWWTHIEASAPSAAPRQVTRLAVSERADNEALIKAAQSMAEQAIARLALLRVPPTFEGLQRR